MTSVPPERSTEAWTGGSERTRQQHPGAARDLVVDSAAVRRSWAGTSRPRNHRRQGPVTPVRITTPSDPLERAADARADEAMAAAGTWTPPDAGVGAADGDGRPLPLRTRRWFESAWGAELGGVRVHGGPAATHSARLLAATAYALGDDIVLGADAGPLDRPAGLRLVAHELAHVVAARSAPRPALLARVATSASDLEAIADEVFRAVDRWGTDEEAIFVALQKLDRDPAAIGRLRSTYQARHKADLEAELRSEMSGTELDYALELIGVAPSSGAAIAAQPPSTPADYDAIAARIRAAVDRLGTDEEAIYAALLPLGHDPARSSLLREAYRRLDLAHPIDLDADLRDDLSGDELAYAMSLLDAPGPAAPKGADFSITGPGDVVPNTPSVVGGAVSVATQIPWQNRKGQEGQLAFGMTYRGGLAADTRWLQFIWRDLVVTDAAHGTRRQSGVIEIENRTYPLTTDPSTPAYSVDSGSETDPFYEARRSTAPRTEGETTLLDAPGPRNKEVRAAFAAGATQVVSGAHFDTYLIRDYHVLYHVAIDVIYTFAGPDSRRSERIVRKVEVVDELPDDIRTALTAKYPRHGYIR